MSKTEISEPHLGHAYDGIQEYDNPLPSWWTNLFIATIAFSIVYGMYFHLGAPDRSVLDQFKASQAAMSKKKYSTLGDLQQNRATLVRFMQDKEWVLYGESIFKTNCSSCHGVDAGGLVGPNLTDEKWKNVQHIEDIIKVINNGAGGNAMPAWKQRFADEPRDIIMLSAYVASRLGKTPTFSNKGPDGTYVIPNWNEDIASLPKDETPSGAPAPAGNPEKK